LDAEVSAGSLKKDLPPYLSHLLQPLDVGCFGALKRAYGGLVKAKMRLGFHYFNKHDFLKAYPIA
jgi:hypothetical protein